jgi:hypothetical protein
VTEWFTIELQAKWIQIVLKPAVIWLYRVYLKRLDKLQEGVLHSQLKKIYKHLSGKEFFMNLVEKLRSTIIHVLKLVTVQLLSLIKLQFTIDAQNAPHVNQCTWVHV